MFDLENDGDLDIVTLDMNDRVQILVSDLTARKAIHWLKIKLVGSKSNRDGIGAAVKVTADGKTYGQTHDGKSGYFAQSSMPLYFGLGNAKAATRVEVRWPSGAQQTIENNIPRNSLLTIQEPR